MRFIPALVGALLITIGVFLFMQSLIQRGRDEGVQLVVHKNVEIFRPDPDQQEPEPDPEQEVPQELAQEPTMDVMEIMQVSPPTPEPATELEIPALDLGIGDIKVSAVGLERAYGSGSCGRWRRRPGWSGLRGGGAV